MKTPKQRYDYHNELFNNWYSKIFLPAKDAFHRGDLSSNQFASYQRKKDLLLANIDEAEKRLKNESVRRLV